MGKREKRPSEGVTRVADARRRPVQARGIERREALLDATARLLDGVGFAATSTNAVAKEAGTSIGTVYEYFPNKESLFRALLVRYRARLGEAMGEPLGAAAVIPWSEVVRRAVRVFYRFYREEPGYRELWLGAQLTDILLETGEEWGRDFTAIVGDVLVGMGLPVERARLVAQVAIHAMSALVTVACQHPPGSEADAFVAEAEIVVIRYLGAYLPPAPAG